jgi:hypothetical protein
VADDGCEVPGADHLDVRRQGRRRRGGGGHHHPVEAGVAQRQHHRQYAGDAAQPAVERQLAHEGRSLELTGRARNRLSDGQLLVQQPAGEQDPHRDREVQAGAGLAQGRGGEVHHDATLRKGDAQRGDRGPNPRGALAHGGLGQSDDVDARQLRADPHLDLDGRAFDADQRPAGYP